MEKNKTNSIRNPFLLKVKKKEKKIIDRIIKDRVITDIWTFCDKKRQRCQKSTKWTRAKKDINDWLVKERIIRDIKIFFEQEDDADYFKLKRVSNFWNNNYIAYENYGNKNKSLSQDEYLDKVRHYLRETTIDL